MEAVSTVDRLNTMHEVSWIFP